MKFSPWISIALAVVLAALLGYYAGTRRATGGAVIRYEIRVISGEPAAIVRLDRITGGVEMVGFERNGGIRRVNLLEPAQNQPTMQTTFGE